MRILVFYQYFGTPKGKWSTRVYELTRRWVEQGHTVTVVTSPYDKSDISAVKLVERIQMDGISLIVINSGDSNRFSIFKRVWRFILFSKLSVWFALTEPYDLAIASSGPITVGLPVIMAKWLRRKPYVFEVRDLWPQGAIEMGLLKSKPAQKLARWFEKLCYKNASVVVACSKGMADDINVRFPKVKTEIIPNASDIELFGKGAAIKDELACIPTETAYCVYAGSLGAMDDVLSVLRAARVLKNREIKNIAIIIIGDGAEREMLVNFVNEHDLDNVKFIGLVSKNEVVGWFHKSVASFVCFKNLAVLSTVSPNKMFDSFAAGVPIIQNTTGWIRQLVDDYKCGINVQPDNDEEMADAIILCASSKDVQVQLAANAERVAYELFDRNKLANKYLDLLNLVVVEGRSSKKNSTQK